MLLAAIAGTRALAAESPRHPPPPIQTSTMPRPQSTSLTSPAVLQALAATQQARQPHVSSPEASVHTLPIRMMPSPRVADPVTTLQALQVRELITEMQRRHEEKQQHEQQQQQLMQLQQQLAPPAPPLRSPARGVFSPHSVAAERGGLLGKRQRGEGDVASILSSLLAPTPQARRLSEQTIPPAATAAGAVVSLSPQARAVAAASEQSSGEVRTSAARPEALAQARIEALSKRTLAKSGGGSVKVSGAVHYRGVRQRPWGKCAPSLVLWMLLRHL